MIVRRLKTKNDKNSELKKILISAEIEPELKDKLTKCYGMLLVKMKIQQSSKTSQISTLSNSYRQVIVDLCTKTFKRFFCKLQLDFA